MPKTNKKQLFHVLASGGEPDKIFQCFCWGGGVGGGVGYWSTLPGSSLALAKHLHATLTPLAYNRVGWGGRWGGGVGYWRSCSHAHYLHATLSRSSIALASYLHATLTRSSLALANYLHATLTFFLHLLTLRRSKTDLTSWLMVQRQTPPCQRHSSWRMRKWTMLLENLFAWSGEDQSQLWVCTQAVSIARGRKSEINFHRAFIPERKARSTKINTTQQELRAASNCQATEKAREDAKVKSEVDQQRVPKLW